MSTAPAAATEKKLLITELVLRDAHQSLFATRMRLDDMLPIAEKLDKIGYWSLETWGGATFDACIRFLGEDPWERMRELKKVMPNTPQQMLLRGQNILGYRHYADDVVRKFVERAAVNGVDIFRIFDAMNDPRNFEAAIKATLDNEKHAQAAISYTVSPAHTLEMWVELGQRLASMGAHSLCIKDMAGLLKPYVAYELVSRLKATVEIPVHLHSHATTGMSTATLVKAAEAGIDGVDVAISPMSMTYGHSSTEAVVAILQDTERDTGLDIIKLEEIAAYFREVRKKYGAFEGNLKGTDSRILVAQVPGGMLTNLENQLRQQKAADRLDEVLEEIPRVRKELGYLPLVTPTSQIVGSQAVVNVLMGQRYASITKETTGVLIGEYGATPAPVDTKLQERVLDGGKAITCRPADLLDPEMDRLTEEVKKLAVEHGFKLAKTAVDDVLTYALFAQVGLKFLQNRNNPKVFEPLPGTESAASPATLATPADSPTVASNGSSVSVAGSPAVYTVTVQGQSFTVSVAEGGDTAAAVPAPAASAPEPGLGITGGRIVHAPLAGDITRVGVNAGDTVQAGDIVVVIEAMKMETQVRTPASGTVTEVFVKRGETIAGGAHLIRVS